jgi:hypothetical protein
MTGGVEIQARQSIGISNRVWRCSRDRRPNVRGADHSRER